MPSLPQDSPASGLGTGFPMVRGPPSELRDFYVTTYQAAFGKRPTGTPQKLKEGRVSGIEPPGDGSIRPLLGVHTGSGYVVNNYSSLRSLISPHVERHDTDVSTTSEDFKVFGRPDYQRMLPEHVDEPQCPYPTGFSFSRLRFGEVKAPKASGEYGTQSHCASPAKPDVPARVTELSGCTGTAPRSDLTLPEQPHSCHGPACPLRPPGAPSGTQGSHCREEATGIQHCPQQVPEQALAAGPRSTRLVGTASNHLGPEICGGHPDPESQWLQHQQPPHHPVAHR
ncbi:uncharacterized protein LOC121339955 isoform X7 [Onychostruthus taczanowskii]|uniref:uncharacterized protein LOC121339955 isoform X7 n=2 Tax=Onychostruthus taczanowskii TaxID=356909 RepID=UPI001B80A7D8|nr:uncharacterized protein LOC121339955 isoform X7 [Onychostruthus taczanowskii]